MKRLFFNLQSKNLLPIHQTLTTTRFKEIPMNVLKVISIAGLMFILSGIQLFAKEMELTLDDGRKVILHEDNTWGFAQFTVSEGDGEDIYNEIGDGRIICLKTDNTWSFTKTRPPEKRSFSELPTVSATATVTKPTLDVAVKLASEGAVKKASDRLLPYAKKSKLTSKYLIACIKNEIGENGIESTYKPGWTAIAKVAITRVQAKHILDCVETQIEANPPPAVETSTKPAVAK